MMTYNFTFANLNNCILQQKRILTIWPDEVFKQNELISLCILKTFSLVSVAFYHINKLGNSKMK